jgi:hypothetical protein
MRSTADFDAVIVGAGFAGLRMLVFMPYSGFPAYVETCHDVVAKGYEGFMLA